MVSQGAIDSGFKYKRRKGSIFCQERGRVQARKLVQHSLYASGQEYGKETDGDEGIDERVEKKYRKNDMKIVYDSQTKK